MFKQNTGCDKILLRSADVLLTNFSFIGNEVLKGTVARKQILFGSTKVSSYRSKGYNGATLYRYTKSGNWNQAKRDFCAVKPTNVERGGKVIIHQSFAITPSDLGEGGVIAVTVCCVFHCPCSAGKMPGICAI